VEGTVSVKKAKDVRFTFQDEKGQLRVVHLQVQHLRSEAGKDRVTVIATSDGVPIEATARVGKASGNKVKTKSRY
jgi:hypothetical protein